MNKKGINKEWKCNLCGQKFRTKKILYEHKHESHSDVIKKRDRSPFICPYCSENLGKGNKRAIWRNHKKNCLEFLKNHTINGQRLWSKEERIKLSEKRKDFLKNNPDKHPWKNNNKFLSKPCEELKNFLKERGYLFEEEVNLVPDKNYSVDICFRDLLLALEVNGNQHYDLEKGCLLPYYQERHDEIEALGWTILEIPYNQSYKKEFREGLCRQLDAQLSSKQFLWGFESPRPYILSLKEKNERKINKEKEKKELKESLISEYPIDLLGRCIIKGPTLSEWNNRKEKILNCGVDLSKYGWVKKVEESTGLTKRIIQTTVKRFKKDFEGKIFIRK